MPDEFFDPYAERVKEFHRALYGTDQGGAVDKATAMCRARLMVEELAELIIAMQTEDHVKIADGLADLLYVVHGTAIVYGVPVNRVFEHVHISNLSKDFPAGGVPRGGGGRRGLPEWNARCSRGTDEGSGS